MIQGLRQFVPVLMKTLEGGMKTSVSFFHSLTHKKYVHQKGLIGLKITILTLTRLTLWLRCRPLGIFTALSGQKA